MPTYKIAHIHEQGNDMIVIPVDSSFGNKMSSDQNAQMVEFQARAHAAGLKGHVVIVWDAGSGRMGFLAPTKWQPFFASINLQIVMATLNKTLSW